MKVLGGISIIIYYYSLFKKKQEYNRIISSYEYIFIKDIHKYLSCPFDEYEYKRCNKYI